MKTPLIYYGGKTSLISLILPIIPLHKVYVEAFVGGGAIFWAKSQSELEIINDNNRELINFYEIVQNDFVALEKMVRISLHSRSIYNDACVIYNNPHMFNRLKRAWAVWVLSAQSFGGKFNGGWGFDKTKNTTAAKVNRKRKAFTSDYAIRLQNVQIECTDALRIIRSRDSKETFFYCDPPYFNSNCGHYEGYSQKDFQELLETLKTIEGKFLLSSYSSEILETHAKNNGWFIEKINQRIRVSGGVGRSNTRKIEVLTANYDLSKVYNPGPTLF